mgnify:CR=1 FL=1
MSTAKNTEKAEEKQGDKLPVPHRFKPGQSGNPKGRPKGQRQLSTILKEALKEIAKGKTGKPLLDPETGEALTWEAALIKRIIDKAIIKGDQKTIEMIFDRIEGKPRQKIDFDDKTKGREDRFDSIKKLVSILTNGQQPPQEEEDSDQTDR